MRRNIDLGEVRSRNQVVRTNVVPRHAAENQFEARILSKRSSSHQCDSTKWGRKLIPECQQLVLVAPGVVAGGSWCGAGGVSGGLW